MAAETGRKLSQTSAHEVSASRPERLSSAARGALPSVAALAVLTPSFVWINLDRSIWPWDPAWYGEVSIELFAKLRIDPGGWVEAMVTAFRSKAPGIAWVGQFFVPLGPDQQALLYSVLFYQAISLALLFTAVRRLGGGSRLPATASLLFISSAPLFVSMSHEYFVEPLQTLAVVWALFVMVSAPRWHPSLTIAQLVGAVALGLLAKASTPVYQAAPSLVALGFAVTTSRQRPSWWRNRGFVSSAALAIGLALGAVSWYQLNLHTAIEQIRLAAGSELWGTSDGFSVKLWAWLDRLNDAAFLPYFGLGVLVLFAAAFVGTLLRARLEFRTTPHAHALLCLAASLATVIVIVVLFALNANNEVRYLLPLIPCLALALGGALQLIESRALTLVVGGILAVQLGLVSLQSFGVRPLAALTYFRLTEPVQHMPFAGELERIVRTTCTEQAAAKISMVGVDYPWLNHNTLALIAAEEFALSGRHCYYTALGLAEQDPNVAWRRVQEFMPPYYISLDYGNLANRLPVELASVAAHSDAFNAVNHAVFRRALSSGQFEPVASSRRLGVVILRATSSPSAP